jgi:anti-anti-sigma regulatory factor
MPVMAGSDQGSSVMRQPEATRCAGAVSTSHAPRGHAGDGAVLEDSYPARWAGRQTVVAPPEHVDVANAGQIQPGLLSVIDRGATAPTADITAAISCDHAGADAVVRAFQWTVVSGTELRLVVTTQRVSPMLSLSGVDRLVCICPSREAATTATTPAAVPPKAIT